jgi:hypothetical protein
MGSLRQIKPKPGLVLHLAKNLNQFLKSSCDVICIREVCILKSYLLRCIKIKRLVDADSVVICIAVLVSAQQQVNIMAQGPPDGRALAVEDHWRQKVQQVFIRQQLFAKLLRGVWICKKLVFMLFI